MNARRFLKLLLAVLVTVGLTVAPLVTPAAAEHSMAAAMMQMADMPDMAADMPCCPDKQKSKDCQDCPLMAICALKNVQTASWTAAALPLRHAIQTRHSVADDVFAEGLDRPPPDQPPRQLT
jgi:hypothetical protein